MFVDKIEINQNSQKNLHPFQRSANILQDIETQKTLISKDYERVINPLLPPERRNHYIDKSAYEVAHGVPINIPTRGYTGGAMQIGALYKQETSDEESKIGQNNEPVIFVSGHFNNFELMAMHIEKSGIDLATIYRPLNNTFLNIIMEIIRKKYICKNQIKKGISGTKELLSFFKNGSSIALMIDQRVSEGIKSNLFSKEAFTTTIPAQFVKKFNSEIIPVYVERSKNDNFKIKFFNSIRFDENDNIETITLKINKTLEDLIVKNPDQWIWTHNRWK